MVVKSNVIGNVVTCFKGEKSLISWHRGYLVVVSNDMRTIPGWVSNLCHFKYHFFYQNTIDYLRLQFYYQICVPIVFRQSSTRPMSLVTIYDIQNKFIGMFCH